MQFDRAQPEIPQREMRRTLQTAVESPARPSRRKQTKNFRISRQRQRLLLPERRADDRVQRWIDARRVLHRLPPAPCGSSAVEAEFSCGRCGTEAAKRMQEGGREGGVLVPVSRLRGPTTAASRRVWGFRRMRKRGALCLKCACCSCCTRTLTAPEILGWKAVNRYLHGTWSNRTQNERKKSAEALGEWCVVYSVVVYGGAPRAVLSSRLKHCESAANAGTCHREGSCVDFFRKKTKSRTVAGTVSCDADCTGALQSTHAHSFCTTPALHIALGTYGPTELIEPSPRPLLKCTCAPPQYSRQGLPRRQW